jgi:hypothetical protein
MLRQMTEFEENADLMNRYKQKFDDFIRNTFDRNYMFEVKKCCCDYTEFVSIEKDASLREFYEKLRKTFVGTRVETIYMVNKLGDVAYLHDVCDVKVRDVISSRPGFSPIYPISANVVYKLQIGKLTDVCDC